LRRGILFLVKKQAGQIFSVKKGAGICLTDGRELALRAGDAADAKSAGVVRVLDMTGVFPAADYFVICSGRNTPHITAIARAVQDELAQAGRTYLRRQGAAESGWVLLDSGDVVVHIFNEEARQFYDLERLWGDAKLVSDTQHPGSAAGMKALT
jgi:ribosome-associated protein